MMKQKTRLSLLLSVMLVFVLAFSLGIATFASAEEKTFDDLTFNSMHGELGLSFNIPEIAQYVKDTTDSSQYNMQDVIGQENFKNFWGKIKVDDKDLDQLKKALDDKNKVPQIHNGNAGAGKLFISFDCNGDLTIDDQRVFKEGTVITFEKGFTPIYKDTEWKLLDSSLANDKSFVYIGGTMREQSSVVLVNTRNAIKTAVGTEVEMGVTVVPEGTITYKVENEEIAEVVEGKLKGKAVGETNVTATCEDQNVTLKVIVFDAYKQMTIDRANYDGAHAVSFFGTGLTAAKDQTNAESYKQQVPETWDNLYIDGKTVEAYNNEKGCNINVHFFAGQLSLYNYVGADAKPWPAETRITFKAGFVNAEKISDTPVTWVAGEYKLEEEVTYILMGKEWVLESNEFRINSVTSAENEGNYLITVNTVNVLSKEETELDETQKANVKLNDKTLTELGATAKWTANALVITVAKEKVTTEAHMTLTLLSGLEAPSSKLNEEVVKTYYSEVNYWGDGLYTGKPEAETVKVLSVEHFAEQLDNADGTVILIHLSEGALTPSFHMNGLPTWQLTTPFASDVSPNLANGSKDALWNGLKIDGKTVWEIMQQSGDDEAAKSTGIIIHYGQTGSYDAQTPSTITIQLKNINKLAEDTDHTVEFLADVFYTNTGAALDGNYTFKYSAQEDAWTDEEGVITEVTGKTSYSVSVGGSITLDAAAKGGSHADTTLNYVVVTPEGEEPVVSVDEKGVVTALKEGTATINVIAANGVSLQVTITVVAATQAGSCGSCSADLGSMGALSLVCLGVYALIRKRR